MPSTTCSTWRAPRLWTGATAPRGSRHRALTLTQSLEPVDHRTLGTDVESDELELGEGPPYVECNILWTGENRNAIATETMRRELEECLYPPESVKDATEGRAEARESMEREWESMATSTSSSNATSRRYGRKRSDAKNQDAGTNAAADTDGSQPQLLNHSRKRSLKRIESEEQRRSVFRTLEMAVEEAIRTREEMGAPRKETAATTFLGNLGDIALLTRAEEGVLMHFVLSGKELQKTKAKLQKENGREPTKDELAEEAGIHVEDVDRIFAEKKRAKALLIQYNLRMVISIAQRYTGQGEELADLLLEGMSGLELATERFNYEKGDKFSTYAYYWIRQAVARFISNQSRIIRLPVHVCEALTKINRVSHELRCEGPVTDAAIAQVLGLDEEKVKLYKKAAIPARSLDAPAFVHYNKRMERDSELLIDSIVVEERSADDVLKDTMIKEKLNILLNTLHPRERNVLRMRYGFHRPGGTSMKLTDISSAYGLSSERIRQIEERALRKLRRPWRRSLLTPA